MDVRLVQGPHPGRAPARAQLTGAQLTGAQLTGAQLTGAQLTGYI
ncbi:pentapeptide repeat-containing protein [Gordonia sp. NPDC058843]